MLASRLGPVWWQSESGRPVSRPVPCMPQANAAFTPRYGPQVRRISGRRRIQAVSAAPQPASTTLLSQPMCRFIAYQGESIYLDEWVCLPGHSLVRQALHAEEAKSVTNGDGFGVGWYGERPEPAVYREVMPAWSDENLMALCRTVRSGLFFAHVRAATGTAVSRHNCHPFQHGQWLFMHNGQIGGYAQLRRVLEAQLPDGLYAARKGSTDSELLFLLALARMAEGLAPAQAMLKVFNDTVAMTRQAGIKEPVRLAAALADGHTLHAFRLASDGRPPSLYLRQDPRGTVLASEPLDKELARWQPLPVGAVLSVRGQTLTLDQAAPAACAATGLACT